MEDPFEKAFLRNLPLSLGFLFPTTFKPLLMSLDGGNYCDYCMPLFDQLGLGKASKVVGNFWIKYKIMYIK